MGKKKPKKQKKKAVKRVSVVPANMEGRVSSVAKIGSPIEVSSVARLSDFVSEAGDDLSEAEGDSIITVKTPQRHRSCLEKRFCVDLNVIIDG